MNHLRFTVAVAVNSRKTLERNLLASPALACPQSVEVLGMEGHPSAASAYNRALDESPSDTVVFVHQDVFLPGRWFEGVASAIDALDAAGARWGVLGAYGCRRGVAGGLGRIFTNGLGYHGVPIASPEPVETLDEIVLILRRSSGLRFDPRLPHFHMYGPDICLQARSAGFTNYAIPAFCVHNTRQLIDLPREFFEGYRYVKRKWRRYLPIYTSCMTITRFDTPLYWRELGRLAERLRGRRKVPVDRVEDPLSLIGDASALQLLSSEGSPQ